MNNNVLEKRAGLELRAGRKRAAFETAPTQLAVAESHRTPRRIDSNPSGRWEDPLTVEETSHGQYRILVIDDNAAIHDDFRKTLCGEPEVGGRLAALDRALFDAPRNEKRAVRFVLDSAYQGQEGLALMHQAIAAGNPYALAFVDVRMPPGWDGIETIDRLWQTDPNLHVVICTAYSDYSWERIEERLGRSDRLFILKKPFDNLEVRQMAGALTEKWRLLRAGAHLALLENQAVGVEGFLIDTTERKRAKAEKAKLEALLLQAHKMECVGRLASGVAHDFNNILAAIMMHLGFLEQSPNPDAGARESLKELMAEAQRAATLTRQLLLFSRKSVLEFKVLDLREVVANMLKMLRRLIGEHISLRFDGDEDLPPVEADPGMLDQVLMNLAINARDAMPKGGHLTFRLESVPVDADRVQGLVEGLPAPFVCLSVADTGCGMDEATRRHIFEPFFTTKGPGEGTGLGLATVAGIVVQHKGWIEVESEVGKGTTFRVFFPATTKGMAARTAMGKPQTFRGCETILFVDTVYLQKPYQIEMMSKTVRECLDKVCHQHVTDMTSI